MLYFHSKHYRPWKQHRIEHFYLILTFGNVIFFLGVIVWVKNKLQILVEQGMCVYSKNHAIQRSEWKVITVVQTLDTQNIEDVKNV